MTVLLAYLSRPLVRWGLIVFAVVALVAGFNWWLSGERREAVEQHKAKVEAKAAPAREEASNERTADAIRNTTSEQELHHVIQAAPTGGEVSPAARALACERLRRAFPPRKLAEMPNYMAVCSR